MKLKDTVLLFSSFISSSIIAQNQQVQPQPSSSTSSIAAIGPTSYLGITVGPSLPLGKYKDSAYARIGLDYALYIEYTLTHSSTSGFGIGFKLDYGFNPINAAAFQTDFNNQLVKQTGDPNYSGILSNSGNLTYYAGYLGIYATYPKGKFTIDWHAMGGAMIGNIPDILVNIYYSGSQVGVGGIAATNGLGVSLDIGAGMRYIPSHSFCFMVKLDFLYANPNFSSGTATITGGPNVPTITDNTFNQVFELVNIGFGIAWIPEHKDFKDRKK